MNLFEIILVSLLGVYVLSSLYFAITGRILAIKERKEDRETTRIQLDFENQIKVLTDRLGQVASENHNLNMSLREWQVAYSQLKKENDELKKKFEESKKKAKRKKDAEQFGEK